MYDRVLGNVHRHTVQCTLPLNLYNEMMFIFLWFWFLVVAGVTALSLACWSFYAVSVPSRVAYVGNHLMMSLDRTAATPAADPAVAMADGPVDRGGGGGGPPPITASSSDVERFVRKYLLCDGCFVLRLVASNSSDLIAAQLTAGLYEHFCRLSGRLPRDPPPPSTTTTADRADVPLRPAVVVPGSLAVPTVPVGLRRFPSKGDGMQG